MPKPRMIRSLGYECEGQTFFCSYEENSLPEGHFYVETLYTGLSAGTELTFYKGTNPYLHSTWDEQLGVFREGQPSIQYPVKFVGYMEVGRVAESRSPAIEEGALVAMAYGHKTGHTANPQADFFVPLPPDLDPLLGIYVGLMGPICANGILHAAADSMGQNVHSLADGVRGRNVLVTGAGVVGLLTGLFALHHGAAAVAVADPTPQRLEAARGLGMIPLDETETEPWQYCKENWHDGGGSRGADIVFQCRAKSESLHTALRCLRPQGTVIDLAFYQGGANDLRLGEEFHHNGLGIRCAQIGRVPRGLAFTWNRKRLALETIDLLRAHGDQVLQYLITDLVPFNESQQVIMDLAAHKQHCLQVVFQVNA